MSKTIVSFVFSIVFAIAGFGLSFYSDTMAYGMTKITDAGIISYIATLPMLMILEIVTAIVVIVGIIVSSKASKSEVKAIKIISRIILVLAILALLINIGILIYTFIKM